MRKKKSFRKVRENSGEEFNIGFKKLRNSWLEVRPLVILRLGMRIRLLKILAHQQHMCH